MADTLTAWKGIALPKLPAEVGSAIDGIAALGNATVSALTVVTSILDIIAGVTIDLDPAKIILNAAITAVEEGLSTLLEDSGAYVLFVPVTRKVIISPLIQDALSLVGLSDTPPPQTVDLDIIALQARLAATSPDVVAFIQHGATGGNAGFFKTVIDSVMDGGDSSRPLFGATDYVAGIHVLAGASDYVQLLSLLTALDGLMLPNLSNTTLTTPGLPVPQNLKAAMVLGGDGSPSAKLIWDAQPAFATHPTVDVMSVITHVAIIRSTNPAAMSATSPTVLFGTAKLTKGMTALGDLETEVVDIFDHAPFGVILNTYTDRKLKKDKTYYYFASFRFRLGDIHDVTSGSLAPDQGHYRFSNVAVGTAQVRPTRSGRGTPPDWIRTPSVIDLLPVAGDLFNLLLATIAQLKSGTTGNADALKKYIDFLKREIEKISKLTLTLTGLVQQLSALTTQTPEVGIYGRVFFGKGGTDFMLADLGASLAPSNGDAGRPTFDRGDEFVTGVVVMVGGPSEDGVVAVKTMLEVMFGAGGAGAIAPLTAAIAAIDAVLTEQETAGFAADFSASPGTAEQSLAAAPGDVPLTTDGSDPGSCAPDTTPAPTFGADFGVLP